MKIVLATTWAAVATSAFFILAQSPADYRTEVRRENLSSPSLGPSPQVAAAKGGAALEAQIVPAAELVSSPWSARKPGQLVAIFETVAPDAKSFVLRGTLPVPPGTWPREDGVAPFALRDFDGAPVETQLEVVSRFANPNEGADVVEVIARVRRDPALPPGTRTRYEVGIASRSGPDSAVSDAPTDRNQPAFQQLLRSEVSKTKALAALLEEAEGIQFSGKDASGAEFRLAPLQLPVCEVLRAGAVVHEVKTYGVMERTAPSEVTELAPLPHLFGVHSYARIFAGEPMLMLDLRINNGGSGLDLASSPLGEVYFENLTLEVPSGFVILQDGLDPGTEGQGTRRLDLITVGRGGTNQIHYMPTQAQLHRRLAIVMEGHEPEARRALEQAGLGFCVASTHLLSWSNPELPSYLPQAQTLPRLDHIGLEKIRADLASDFQALRKNLNEGTGRGHYPLESGRLGWAHPFGVAYGGMTGGAEINLLEGVAVAGALSQEGYRHLQDVHRMQTDRMPVALYNTTGTPSGIWDWVEQTGGSGSFEFVPFNYFNGSMPGRDKRNRADSFGYSKADREQLVYVRDHHLNPDYEDALRKFQPHDSQHLVRYTRSAKALAWLGNDSLAKDDLLMVAENFHMEYHQLPNDSKGQPQGTGLLAAIREVEARAGMGFTIGRGQGWGLDAVAAAYALSRDDRWRARVRTEWLEVVVETVAKGQAACSGFLQSKSTGRWLGGKYRVRQSIEQAILESALEGLRTRVFKGVDPVREAQLQGVLSASYQSMISDISWPAGNGGPWSHLAVGSADGAILFCEADELPSDGHDQYTDGFQVGQSLARGFAQTGDKRFLEKAAELVGGKSLLEGLEAAGLKNLVNQAALLELAQRQ